MTTLGSRRVVYKVVDGQEIDADVYVPEHKSAFQAPIRRCTSL
jgi:hypothetical protein